MLCSMKTPTPPPSVDVQALDYLCRLFRTGSGYHLRGVRGWARTAEIEEQIKQRIAELMPRLARRGLVSREDVRAPLRVRPLWVYRITGAGVQCLAGRMDVWVREVDEPAPLDAALPRHVYVPRACQMVLDELRRAADDPASPTPFAGEPGWLTSWELDARVPLTFTDLDLHWLQVGQVIEKRYLTPSTRRVNPVVYYRITQAGRLLRPLVWCPPDALTRLEPRQAVAPG
jgi:hypothetical protein